MTTYVKKALQTKYCQNTEISNNCVGAENDVFKLNFVQFTCAEMKMKMKTLKSHPVNIFFIIIMSCKFYIKNAYNRMFQSMFFKLGVLQKFWFFKIQSKNFFFRAELPDKNCVFFFKNLIKKYIFV